MAERGLGTVPSTQDSMVSKCSLATNTVVVMGLHFHLRVLTWELQHLSPKLFHSSKITKEILALNCATLPKQYSMNTCQGQPGSLAAGCYFARESQPDMQGNNVGNLTVRRLLLPMRNMLYGWGSSCTSRVSIACWTISGCVKRCTFKELCVLSSCNNVQL